MKKFKKSKGVTLIELLVILAILALLILAAIFTWRLQLSKGRDAKRKADLHHLQNILEDYYNDHNAYPPDLDCGESLLPYLQEIYCDPSGQSYFYQVAADDSYYRIYAKFENKNDPGIEEAGCLGGCGPGCQYDFGVASQNTNLEACEACELPNLPAIGPDGTCPPGSCMQCPGTMVCLPQGNCCRPREFGECL